MTPAQLAEWKRLAQWAAPLRWFCEIPPETASQCPTYPDATAIARTLFPAVSTLAAEVERLREALWHVVNSTGNPIGIARAALKETTCPT